MKIIFAHGKEGSPKGKKATYLREHFNAITPDLSGMALSDQVGVLKQLIKENPDCLLIGSSMGGAACALASWEVRPRKILLLAPALNYEECKEGIPKGLETVFIHGLNDDIIPYQVSEKVAKETNSKLILVEDDHRLGKSKKDIINEVKELMS